MSFDKAGNPVSVNNAFFTSCDIIPCNHENQQKGPLYCDMRTPDGNGVGHFAPKDKDGNFLDACDDGEEGRKDITAFIGAYNYASDGGSKKYYGGATAWLRSQAPVKGNEVITLDFYIWDTGDSSYDSTVIIDDFRRRFQPAEVGTDKDPIVIDPINR